MIKLKKEIRRKGVDLSQIYRDNKLAIYVARQKHLDDDGYSEWYEVFKITIEKPNTFYDDDWERYPSDNLFGLTAWSCADASVVAKVIYLNFNNHPAAKQLENYIDHYYSSGGRNIPYFKISIEQLTDILSVECLYSFQGLP